MTDTTEISKIGLIIMAILVLIIAVAVILVIVELQKENRIKQEIKEVFFSSGLAERLGDEFQSLFGRRDIYRTYFLPLRRPFFPPSQTSNEITGKSRLFPVCFA